MGVKDLWNVLAPIAHKCSLYDLQDKVVAIDLSCWVCEGQSIGEKASQTRLYLRNIFFRTQALLLMNMKPVFILEGEAPALKLAAMKQRNDARFKRYQNSDEEPAGSSRRKGNRTRFKNILKQCQEMLENMGVMCLQSEGEAEALCGQLNRDGLVDAVITQDSDVFLYGARTVLRNLTIKAGTGTVELYEMTDIEKKLNLTREKLVAMSLLCGCDYDQSGVHGVGKELAYNYLSTLQKDVLDRLRQLRDDKTLQRFEEERQGCTKCCHPGKSTDHRRDGCSRCESSKGCAENVSPLAFKNLEEQEKKEVAQELNLRRKVIVDTSFPNEETINEYLSTRQTIDLSSPSWTKPNICKFVPFCVKMLEWEVEYAFEKILPLLTRWLLLKSNLLEDEIIPVNIVKKKILKGVASFDLAWKAVDENIERFLTLLPEDSEVLNDGLFISTEPQVIVSEKLPELFAEFTERNNKKKKAKKSKKVNVEDDFGLNSLSVKETKDNSKKATKKNTKLPENEIADLPGCSFQSPTEKLYEKYIRFSEDSIIILDTPETENAPSFLEIDYAIQDAVEKFMPTCNYNPKIVFENEQELSEDENLINDRFYNEISDPEDSTVDYDISEIVDDIISRQRFF